MVKPAEADNPHQVYFDTEGVDLVLDNVLALAKRPAMQARTHMLTHPDALADVGQILQHDSARTDTLGFADNRLADFMVEVGDTPRLLAGDLSERYQLLGTLCHADAAYPTAGFAAQLGGAVAPVAGHRAG